MAKRIVYCADGTWNRAESGTNVVKMFHATVVGPDQITYYDVGVGADGTPLDKLAGGNGIFQKIKNGYTKIAHVYEAGDETFLFGFSRGAYTARSLAGMIAICGLPTANFDDRLVETAFPAQRQALLASLSAYELFDAKISKIGVWDTVGSLGIPSLFGGIDPHLYGFLDTSLHPDVLHAYQALL